MLVQRGHCARGSRRKTGSRGGFFAALLLAGSLSSLGWAAHAESIDEALVKAYQNNPQLTAERARQRGTDENVPQALSTYRPQITGELSAGLIAVRNLLPGNVIDTGRLRPWTIGVTVTQTLFNGFRTANSVRQAESQVRSGREALRNVGQSVLLDAATAYMTVATNQELVNVEQLNVKLLRETLTVTRTRLAAGSVTPTDVAQAEARLSRGLADLNAAEVALAISKASYVQVIGTEPGKLIFPSPTRHPLPTTREGALEIAQREHPAILAASFDADSATSAVLIAQGALLPTVTVQGNVNRSVSTDTNLDINRTDQASVIGNVNVPIYDGGLAASQTRQAKEIVTQSRAVLEQVRNQTRAAVAGAFVAVEGARVAYAAAESEVRAATVALEGVRKEASGGQRATIDVLNAQQDLTSARGRLVQAQRDRVIAAFTLMSAIGRLDVKHLNLKTSEYLPEVHYHQVRDAWHGLRTPSGK